MPPPTVFWGTIRISRVNITVDYFYGCWRPSTQTHKGEICIWSFSAVQTRVSQMTSHGRHDDVTPSFTKFWVKLVQKIHQSKCKLVRVGKQKLSLPIWRAQRRSTRREMFAKPGELKLQSKQPEKFQTNISYVQERFFRRCYSSRCGLLVVERAVQSKYVSRLVSQIRYKRNEENYGLVMGVTSLDILWRTLFPSLSLPLHI